MGMLFCRYVLGCTGYENTTILEIYELLWKLTLLAASWGVSSFLLFLWRTVCAVKPPKPQVPLRQMAEKIKNVEEKSRELAENISAWKQKENLKTVEKDNAYLNNIIQITLAKLQAARAQDAKSPHSPGVLKTRSEDSMQTVVMTEDCNPEGRKKKMQGHHAASGSVKAAEEARFQRRKKKVRWFDETCGQRNMGTEGKVDVKGCELVGKQQLLAAEERAKLAEKETKQHKRRLEECHGQMREAEITLGLQVILAEKEAQDNWIRARELERENAEWRREVAHMKQRLDAICRERQAEEYMRQQAEEAQVYGNERVPYPISAAPCRFYPSEYPPAPFLGYRPPPPSPPWCSPGPYQTPLSPLFGPGAAPVQPGSSRQPEAALEAQVTLGVGGPHPFTGPACMACLISSPSSPSGPPAPGPPLCPVQPRPPAPPAPLDATSMCPSEEVKQKSSYNMEGLATEPATDSQTFGLAPGPVTAHDTLSCVDGAGPADTFGHVTVPQSGEPDEADFFSDKEGLATEPATDSQTFGLAPGPVTAHDTLSCVDGAGPADTFGHVTVPQSGEPDEADFFSDKEGLATEPATDSQTFGLAPGPVTAHDTLSCVDGAGPADTFGHVTVPQSGEPDEADFFSDKEGLATEPATDSQTFGLAPGPVTAHDTLSCVDGAGPADTFGHVTVPQSGEPDEADFFSDKEGLATEPATDSQTFGLAPGPVTAHDTLSCVDGAGPADTFGHVTVPQSGEPDEADFFSDKEGLATEPATDSQTFGLAPGPVTAHDTLSCVDGAGPADTFGHVTVPQSGEPDEADFFSDKEGLATEPATDSQTFGLAPGPVTAHDTLSCVDGAGPADTFGHVTVPQSGEPDEADFFSDKEGLATEPATDSQTFGLAPGPVTAHDTLSCVDGAGPADTFGHVTVPQSGEPDEADFFSDKEGLATEPATDSQTFGLAPGPVTAHDTLSCVDGAGPADTFGHVTVPQSGEPDEADFFSDKEGLATEPATDSQTFGLAPGPVTAHDTLSCVDGAGPADTFGHVTVPQSGEPDEADFFSDKEGLATEPATDSQTFGLAPGPVTAHDTLSCVDGAGPADTFGHVTVPQSGEPDEADFFSDKEGLATEPATDSQTFGLAPGPVTAHDTLSCVDGAGPADTFGHVTVPQSGEPDEADFFSDKEGLATEPATDSQTFGLAPGPVTAHDTLSCVDGAGPADTFGHVTVPQSGEPDEADFFSDKEGLATEPATDSQTFGLAPGPVTAHDTLSCVDGAGPADTFGHVTVPQSGEPDEADFFSDKEGLATEPATDSQTFGLAPGPVTAHDTLSCVDGAGPADTFGHVTVPQSGEPDEADFFSDKEGLATEPATDSQTFGLAPGPVTAHDTLSCVDGAGPADTFGHVTVPQSGEPDEADFFSDKEGLATEPATDSQTFGLAPGPVTAHDTLSCVDGAGPADTFGHVTVPQSGEPDEADFFSDKEGLATEPATDSQTFGLAPGPVTAHDTLSCVDGAGPADTFGHVTVPQSGEPDEADFFSDKEGLATEPATDSQTFGLAPGPVTAHDTLSCVDGAGPADTFGHVTVPQSGEPDEADFFSDKEGLATEPATDSQTFGLAPGPVTAHDTLSCVDGAGPADTFGHVTVPQSGEPDEADFFSDKEGLATEPATDSQTFGLAPGPVTAHDTLSCVDGAGPADTFGHVTVPQSGEPDEADFFSDKEGLATEPATDSQTFGLAPGPVTAHDTLSCVDGAGPADTFGHVTVPQSGEPDEADFFSDKEGLATEPATDSQTFGLAPGPVTAHDTLSCVDGAGPADTFGHVTVPQSGEPDEADFFSDKEGLATEPATDSQTFGLAPGPVTAHDTLSCVDGAGPADTFGHVTVPQSGEPDEADFFSDKEGLATEPATDSQTFGLAPGPVTAHDTLSCVDGAGPADTFGHVTVPQSGEPDEADFFSDKEGLATEPATDSQTFGLAPGPVTAHDTLSCVDGAGPADTFGHVTVPQSGEPDEADFFSDKEGLATEPATDSQTFGLAPGPVTAHDTLSCVDGAGPADTFGHVTVPQSGEPDEADFFSDKEGLATEPATDSQTFGLAPGPVTAHDTLSCVDGAGPADTFGHVTVPQSGEPDEADFFSDKEGLATEPATDSQTFGLAPGPVTAHDTLSCVDGAGPADTFGHVTVPQSGEPDEADFFSDKEGLATEQATDSQTFGLAPGPVTAHDTLSCVDGAGPADTFGHVTVPQSGEPDEADFFSDKEGLATEPATDSQTFGLAPGPVTAHDTLSCVDGAGPADTFGHVTVPQSGEPDEADFFSDKEGLATEQATDSQTFGLAPGPVTAHDTLSCVDGAGPADTFGHVTVPQSGEPDEADFFSDKEGLATEPATDSQTFGLAPGPVTAHDTLSCVDGAGPADTFGHVTVPQSGEPDEADFFSDKEGLATEPATDSQTFGLAPGPVTAHDTLSCVDGAGPADTFGHVTVPQSGEPDEADFFSDKEGLATEPATDSQTFGLAPGPVTAHDTLSCVDGAGPADTFGHVTVPQSGEPDEADFFSDKEGLATEPATDSQTFGLAPGPVTAHDTLSCVDGAGPADTFGHVTVPQSGEPDEADFFSDKEGLATEPATDSQTFGLAPGPVTAHDTLSCVDGAGPADTFGHVTVPQSGEPDEADFFSDKEGLATEPATDSQTFGLAPGPVTAHDTLSCVDGAGPADTFGHVTVPQSGEPDEADFFSDKEGLATEPATDSQTFGLAPGPVTAHDTLSCVDGAGPADTFGHVTVPQSGEPDEADFFSDKEGLATEPATDSQTFGLAPGPVTAHDTLSCVDGAGPADTFGHVTVPQSGEPDEADFFSDKEGLATEPATDSQTFGLAPGPVTAHDTLSCVDGAGPADTFGHVTVPQSGEPDEADFFSDKEGLATEPATDSQTFGLAPGPVTAHDTLSCVDGAGPADTFGHVTVPQSGEPDEADFFSDKEGLATEPATDSQTFGLAPGPVTAHDTLSCVDGAGPADTFGHVTVPQSGEPDEADFFSDKEGLATEPATDSQTFGLAPGPVTAHDTLSCVDGAGPADTFGHVTVPQSGEPDEADFFSDKEGLATEPATDSQTFGLAPGPVTAHDTLSCVDGAGPADTFGHVTVPQSGEPDEADFFSDKEGLATEPATDSQTFGLAPGPVTAHDTLSCVDGAGPADTFGHVTVPQSGEPDEADFFSDKEGLATEPATDSQTFGLAPGPVTAHDTLSCVDGAGPADTFGHVTVPQSGEPDEADFFSDKEEFLLLNTNCVPGS
ncbi:uncharacterized protein [Vicugna pacos]|uniref:Uncharacterized protein n=1 Tax=Vicugna pacos TaxID=30538 RepID=A0ABM5BDK0_VICPA